MGVKQWGKFTSLQYYGVSRLTANSTDLVLEYLASEDGVPNINDVVTLTHET